jgi:hypothetical protein
MNDIIVSEVEICRYKKIYYHIMNSEAYDVEQKEIYIFTLWYFIHEIYFKSDMIEGIADGYEQIKYENTFFIPLDVDFGIRLSEEIIKEAEKIHKDHPYIYRIITYFNNTGINLYDKLLSIYEKEGLEVVKKSHLNSQHQLDFIFTLIYGIYNINEIIKKIE